MSDKTDLFHHNCSGANGLISEAANGYVLRADCPDEMSGHCFFRLLFGVHASTENQTVTIVWPAKQAVQHSDYNNNDNFSSVLDRCLFLDHGDGRWQRITDVLAIGDNSVRFSLPAGPSGRRLAVGMPVTEDDLQSLLDLAQRHPAAELRQLGTAPMGSPIHAIRIGEGNAAQGSIIIQAYQHDSEWAGLRMLSAALPCLLSDAGRALRQRYVWQIYPAANADGLRYGWRGDPKASLGINPNRDWAAFTRPETALVRDDIAAWTAHEPQLLHAVDLHMGWNWRNCAGSALSSFVPGSIDDACIAWQDALSHRLFAATDFSDFIWRSTDPQRPNFCAWISSRYGIAAQTLEVSRHLWWSHAQNKWRCGNQADEEALGRSLVQVIDAHLRKTGPAPQAQQVIR